MKKGFPIAQFERAAFASVCLLAACGGGGGGGEEVLTVSADGAPIDPVDFASYTGKTFPISIVSGTSGSPEGVVDVQKGSLEVINANTLDIVFSPGEMPTRYFRQGTSNVFENSTGYEITIDSAGFLHLLYTEPGLVPWVSTLVVGSFGFQTPQNLYPSGVVTYDQRFASALYIAIDGDSDITPIFAGNVSLTVDFAGSSVTGTLMDGSRIVDLDDDSAVDDELSVQITMNGHLSGNGITGTIDGSAFADIDDDGVDVTDLNLVMESSSVEGVFYGNSADRIGGTYTGEFTFDDPVEGSSSGTAAGYFDAARF